MALFTIGYEGLDKSQFLAHLSGHEIEVVADVRKLPLSRKKGFSKTALKEMLNFQNVDYLNFQGLGAVKELRDKLYQTGDYQWFFKQYRDSIADKQDLLKTINLLVGQGKNVSLLCYERNPQQCHRRVVAEEIKRLNGNGLIIRHIIPD